MSEEPIKLEFEPPEELSAEYKRIEEYEFKASRAGWYHVPCINDEGEVTGHRFVELKQGESAGIAFKDGRWVKLDRTTPRATNT